MAAASSGSKSKWDDCLSNLGRKVYVSQRGLEGVLKELREHGLLTEEVPASRKSIKRAREDDLAARATRYGPLIQHMDIQHEDGLGRTVRLPYISPAALLSHLAEQPQFGSFLAAALRASPGSYETPWTLCVYADEVSPGNALKPVNWRRQWAVYWSLREFGPDGLACENLWFPLCVLRSHLTSAVGGLTVLWTHALRKFFGAPHNLRAGVLLETPEGQHVLFAKLGILIADEAAIKHSLENKGASGTLFCVRCSNVVPDRTGLNEVSNDVIGSRCLDFSKFKLHSNESTRNAVLFLQEQSTLVGKTRFADLEKALGFNYKPEGLLLDEAVGYAVPEAVMFDWLHIYLVHGVAGNEVGHLLGCLRDAGFPESRLSEFLESFTWPAQFAGSSPTVILAQKRDTKTAALKGSASEQLNFFPVLRLFILLYVVRNGPAELQEPCRCFFLLCKVLELLQQATRGDPVDPNVLHTAIVQHARCLLETYGDEIWVPKNHMALHLAEFLRRHKCLLSCFVQERKHKLLKRFSNNMNSAMSFETSLLKDVLAAQLESLTHSLPSREPRLLEKKPAARKLKELVQQCMQCQEPVFQAAKAVHGGGFQCSPGDVVVFHVQQEGVGQIDFLAECNGLAMACVSVWEHVHGHMYKVQAESLLMRVASIRACCIFSQKDRQSLMIRP